MGVALPPELVAPAEVPEIEVWQENWPAVQLFVHMRTQLRVSAAGVEGLDYGVLPVVEQRLRLRPRDARSAFIGLQVMERALIAHMNA